MAIEIVDVPVNVVIFQVMLVYQRAHVLKTCPLRVKAAYCVYLDITQVPRIVG